MDECDPVQQTAVRAIEANWPPDWAFAELGAKRIAVLLEEHSDEPAPHPDGDWVLHAAVMKILDAVDEYGGRAVVVNSGSSADTDLIIFERESLGIAELYDAEVLLVHDPTRAVGPKPGFWLVSAQGRAVIIARTSEGFCAAIAHLAELGEAAYTTLPVAWPR